MNTQLDLIDDTQTQITYKEISYNNLKTLNKDRNTRDNLILYLNIRSINKNFEKLQVFIRRLKIKPYIIVCAESWVVEQQHLYHLMGYKIYYNTSAINKSDGVVVYISDKVIEKTEITAIGRLKIINSTIHLNNNSKLEVSALYKSHDLNNLEFIHNLKNYLQIKKNVKNHIILGDYNINILEYNVVSQEFLEGFLEKGFLPGFKSTTRPFNITTSEGTCIDNIFIKATNIKAKTFKLEDPFTDHYPLFVDISKQIKEKRIEDKKPEYFYNYKKLYINAKQVDWKVSQLTQDPNTSINNLIAKIKMCVEKAKSKKCIKNKTKKIPRKGWITESIINSCIKKETLYKQLKRNPNNDQLKTYYKQYIKTLDKCIKTAKIKYEKNYIEINSNNPKQLWTIINSKVNKNKESKHVINEIESNTKEIIKDPREIANKLNLYYARLGQEMNSKIRATRSTANKLPRKCNESIFIKPTDKYEVQRIIDELKLKNGGVDNINAKTLKVLKPLISEPLANILNQCIETAIWPEALKTAEIVPIYKGGDKLKMGNYRPISLISNVAKVFEKMLHNRIYNFILKNKILNTKQYGFIKNRGTKDALNEITNRVYENLDRSMPIIVTFLDLAKAFDTVNHDILLEKLWTYGIRGKPHQLLKDYLNKRKLKVRIGNVTSDYEEINIGVPQGTILGPLLFILYVNDLLDSMPENSILSYADDTAIISTNKTWKQTEMRMNKLLESAADWLALNKLTLNITKTVYITFGNYTDSVPNKLDIKIDKETIRRVENCKYLGVIFDQNLKWNEHINYIIKKTRYLIYIFYKISKYMHRETLKIIYYAFFHSIITYGIIGWGGAYSNSLQRLEKLEARVHKIINKNDFVNDNPLNIQQAYAYESLLYNFNTLKFTYLNSASITRSKLILLPKNTKRVSDKSNYIKAIKLYNKLPNDYKTLDTKKKSAKDKIKDWIRNHEIPR